MADSESRKRKIEEVDVDSDPTNKRTRTAEPPAGADDICSTCRRGQDLIYCLGSCRRAFHRACAALTTDSALYYCAECLQHQHACFICRGTTDSPQKCTLLTCGKFYHETCAHSHSLTKLGKEPGTFVCPRHVCHVCREEASASHALLYCFECCAAYHQSCQPDCQPLSSMYCLCNKCQRVTPESVTNEAPKVTPVSATPASTALYNNPLDPRLASYDPALKDALSHLLTAQTPVPVEPVAIEPTEEGETTSGPALPTDRSELKRLAAMGEWDLYDIGYSEDQVKELKRRATPPPSTRGGFRGRGRGRGSFDSSRDTRRSSERSSKYDSEPRDTRSSYSSRYDRPRSPSPPRPSYSSRHDRPRSPSPPRTSYSRYDRPRSPVPASRFPRRSCDPSPPERDRSRYSHRSASPPPPPAPLPVTFVPEPSVKQAPYQPLTVAGPTIELTKHSRLICALDMTTVSGPKLEMPTQLELMSCVPIALIKTIAANTTVSKTVIKLTPRPGSEAQCENLLYYLKSENKASLFTLNTRHKVFVFSNKEDFLADYPALKKDAISLCGFGVYQTDLNYIL